MPTPYRLGDFHDIQHARVCMEEIKKRWPTVTPAMTEHPIEEIAKDHIVATLFAEVSSGLAATSLIGFVEGFLAVTEPYTAKEYITGPLKCPSCGGGPAGIRYCEHIENWRQVTSQDEDGRIHIDGFYSTGEGYDDGHDAYWECHNTPSEGEPFRECFHTWPVNPVQSENLLFD